MPGSGIQTFSMLRVHARDAVEAEAVAVGDVEHGVVGALDDVARRFADHGRKRGEPWLGGGARLSDGSHREQAGPQRERDAFHGDAG